MTLGPLLSARENRCERVHPRAPSPRRVKREGGTFHDSNQKNVEVLACGIVGVMYSPARTNAQRGSTSALSVKSGEGSRGGKCVAIFRGVFVRLLEQR